MTAPAATDILDAPGSTAKIKARLKAGYKVKADFLEGGWYAVFRLNEKVRSKKKALGYVAAKHLKAAAMPLQSVKQPVKAAAKPALKAGEAPPQAITEPVPPKAGTNGAKFVIDLTAPPKAGRAAAKAAAPQPTPEASKAEAKALADQLLPPKANTVEGTAPGDHAAEPKVNTTEGKAAAGAVAPDEGDEAIILRDITFQAGPGGHEKVFITLNRQAAPVLSSIQNESPRVVADFKNVASVRPGLQNIPVDGNFIKRIRSSYNPETRSLRVVLDLDPSKNYLVNQLFSQADNIYAFDLSEDPENPVR